MRCLFSHALHGAFLQGRAWSDPQCLHSARRPQCAAAAWQHGSGGSGGSGSSSGGAPQRRQHRTAPRTTAAAAAAEAPSGGSQQGQGSAAAAAAAAAAEEEEELCVIVDENNVLRGKPRSVTVSQRLLGRGSYVLVFDGEGRLLVSRRSESKDVYPGYYDVVTSGVVRCGEEYEDCALRELSEELGAPPSAFTPTLRRLFVFPYEDEWCHVFGAAFEVVLSAGQPLALQEEEVDSGGFVQLEQVAEMLQQQRFVPVGRLILERYLSEREKPQQQQRQRQQGGAGGGSSSTGGRR